MALIYDDVEGLGDRQLQFPLDLLEVLVLVQELLDLQDLVLAVVVDVVLGVLFVLQVLDDLLVLVANPLARLVDDVVHDLDRDLLARQVGQLVAFVADLTHDQRVQPEVFGAVLDVQVQLVDVLL